MKIIEKIRKKFAAATKNFEKLRRFLKVRRTKNGKT